MSSRTFWLAIALLVVFTCAWCASLHYGRPDICKYLIDLVYFAGMFAVGFIIARRT